MAISREFSINGFTIAAQEWGNPKGRPVIALHGWLDNSASFDIIGPKLQSVRLIALDLAGHGHSDHRLGMMDYFLLADVADIIGIANQLELEQFGLLGHSRGAMISFLLAGSLASRISHVLMLDAFCPPATDASQSPDRLARAIKGISRKSKREKVYYPTIEAAVDARCQSEFAIERVAAQLIVERGIAKSEKGYYWRSDSKLFSPSFAALTHEQIMAFANNITADLKLMVGSEGLSVSSNADIYHAMVDMANHLSVPTATVSGGHFFHMEAGASDTIAEIEQFF